MDKNSKNNKFKIGSLVRVRSAESISKFFDSSNKTDGCIFMSQMWDYCGQKFKVLKVVSNFFDEHGFKMYTTKTPLYILDGLICDGKITSFNHQCDRSCYLFWHENWLSKPQS